MSKTATTKPPKQATTPAKKTPTSVRQTAPKAKEVLGTQAKKTSVSNRKQPLTQKPAVSDKSYKTKPNGNPTVTHGLPSSSYKKNPTVTRRLTQSNPTVSPSEAPPQPAASAPAPRPLFRRATVTLTATMDVPQGHQEAAQTHTSGLRTHEGGESVRTPAARAPGAGTPAGTSAASGVPPAAQAAPQGAPAGTPAPKLKPLNDLEKRFAFEYAQDCNATRAYMRATGTTRETTAATQGWKWLRREEIRAQIDLELLEIQKRAGISTEDVLRRLFMIATADARELVEHVIESCRYCHGKDGLYQRTDTEMRRDRAEFENLGRQRIDGVYVGKKRRKADNDPEAPPEVFQEQGGGGFSPHEPPNPECGSCHGYGIARAVFKDTRLLSPAAAMLYQGIEETKEGLKVRFIDQMVAMEKVNKHIGFYGVDNRQKQSLDPFSAMLASISGPSAALPVNPNPSEEDEA